MLYSFTEGKQLIRKCLVSSFFFIFLYRSSLRLICLRMLWVIQGWENLPRIILVGIHLEVRVSSVVTKSDQSSSTDLFE